ncbi:hypothetical protein NQ318_008850 [Aromia moschata]|uniref:Nuclear pore protein n=1 Tax=Aromia moschata TaxID=1265417 RepID=A0AAV8ZAP8_9CUCU|nr:hypothetical protein NQ318_008850 [Aromia moschata]
MKTLNELQIVPLRPEELDERVKNFKNLTGDVCKIMPDVLLATMNMYQDGSMEKMGGEGHVGTVREVNLPESPDQTVVVQWDNGSQLNCRTGNNNRYDLRVIDNAQIGIRHRHICDGCDNNIRGMRYHCNCCHDYDLCYICYHGDKHNLTHSFKRFDHEASKGVNVAPRMNARKCELRGIFKGAKIVRGYDWEWGDQDGGQGNDGIVLDIRGWERKSGRSVANVKWLTGNSHLYRLGHKGFCDIQFVESSSGGEYYPEHLPILGQAEEEMEWNGILDAIDRQNIMQLEKESASEVCQNDDLTLLSLSPFESAYASVIIEYNKMVNGSPVDKYDEIISTKSQQLDLLDKISGIEFKDEEVKEIWETVKYMTKLPAVPQTQSVIETRNSSSFIKVLVTQGQQFLENRFKIHMKSVVEEDTSPDGNTPGLYNLVHSFVGLRFKGEYMGLQDGTIDGRPLWPMVYYCLRAGDLSGAIYCLRESGLLEFKDILCVLDMKVDDPTNPEIDVVEENLRISYQKNIRNCTDPFKRIIWAILGCYNEESEYGIMDNGESQYDAFNHPLLYFKLLMLTGQFEAATEFLFRTEKFKVHGVHVAIILNEFKLLAVSQDFRALLLSVRDEDPKHVCHLNFVLLIKNYVEKFNANCPIAALNYFFLLRNFSSTEGKNVFEVCVADLVVKTKEYVKILGKVDRTGRAGETTRVYYKTSCLTDQFKISCLFRNVVAEIKSQIMVNSENWEELVDFYDTDQESVLRFMCEMLSKVAHLENQPDSFRNRLQEKAISIDGQYIANGYNKHHTTYVSFTKAKDLLTFFDQYRARRYLEALTILAELQIVPLKLEDLERQVRSFPMLSGDLVRVIPHLLLATMTMLMSQCTKIKHAPQPIQKHLKWVWEQANTVTNFAERLPRELIGDTLYRLVMAKPNRDRVKPRRSSRDVENSTAYNSFWRRTDIVLVI